MDRRTLVLGAAALALAPRPGAAPGLVWAADHETGDLSQWEAGQGQAAYNTGTGRVDVVAEVARSGRFAQRHAITGADGTPQATRVFRLADNHAAATYSAWLYLPQRHTGMRWWNVFQWKSYDAAGSQPCFSLDVGNRADGAMYLYLWSSLDARGWAPLAELELPVGRWVQVAGWYKRSAGGEGAVRVWQDGAPLADVAGVRTALVSPGRGENVNWSLCNYTDYVDGGAATLYWDDAEIRPDR